MFRFEIFTTGHEEHEGSQGRYNSMFSRVSALKFIILRRVI